MIVSSVASKPRAYAGFCRFVGCDVTQHWSSMGHLRAYLRRLSQAPESSDVHRRRQGLSYGSWSQRELGSSPDSATYQLWDKSFCSFPFCICVRRKHEWFIVTVCSTWHLELALVSMSDWWYSYYHYYTKCKDCPGSDCRKGQGTGWWGDLTAHTGGFRLIRPMIPTAYSFYICKIAMVILSWV